MTQRPDDQQIDDEIRGHLAIEIQERTRDRQAGVADR
ncbi:MAG: hypothetical protein RLZZ53_1454 [Acidobacteriota bacterium]|jgi:hypothetical protein